VAVGDQLAHGLLDLAIGIQRRFQEITIERHAERGQVGILLATQVRDGELADGVEIAGVVLAGHHVAFDLHAVAAQVGLGHVADVVAVVGIRRPASSPGFRPRARACTGAGEVLDLHAGIVVVELALHVPAVGGHHARDAVADHAGAAVADMQRAGRVGRHVFHAHRLAVAAGVAAEAVARRHGCRAPAAARRRRQVDVDEAGPREFDLRDGIRGGQGVDQLLRQRARIGLRPALAKLTGQQHRRIGREVAVRALLRSLDEKSGEARSTGRVPAARRADRPCSIRARSWVFTKDQAAVSMAAHCTRGGSRDVSARQLQPPFNAFQPCVVAVEQHLLLGISDGKCAKVLDDRRLPGFKVAGAARQIFKLALDAILPGLEAF
jgi:hypothetical protein